MLQTHPLSIQYGVEQVLIENDATPPISDVCTCCTDISGHIDKETKEHAKTRLTWCLGKINANINGVYLTNGFDEDGTIHTSERILLTRLSTSNIVAELAQNILNEETNMPLQTPKWLTDAEQFDEFMSWSNQGTWHIDHRIPTSAFDLTNPIEQRACFHFLNLQPMWGSDNIRKKDKYEMCDKIKYMKEWYEFCY